MSGYGNQGGLTPRKVKLLITGAVLLIAGLVSLTSLVEVNHVGYYQFKQSVWGKITHITDSGPYGQLFGKIWTYKVSDAVYLSADSQDGGSGAETQAVRVAFPDGTADVNVEVQYELSRAYEDAFVLHERYSSNLAVKRMIRKQIIEAIGNTGTLMNSGDAYADKKPEFARLAREQALHGLYASEVTEAVVIDKNGNRTVIKHYNVALDDQGEPIITKESVLEQFGITFENFNVTDMNFDEKVTALIEARKDAQKAQQDAITAQAKGEALIATAKAEQEVEKMTEVTIAEKNKVVAELDAEKLYRVAEFAKLEAMERAQAIIAEGRATAEKNKLLVNAGLTPIEKAMIEKETAIGVAKELAKVKFPGMLVLGGSGANGSALNPFDAVGLQSFIQISRDLATGATTPTSPQKK